MDHVLEVGLHTQPGAELRKVGELHRGFPGGWGTGSHLGALVVRSIPRGGHCQAQRVLRATREWGVKGEPAARVAADLVPPPIAQTELHERCQGTWASAPRRPHRLVPNEVRPAAAAM